MWERMNDKQKILKTHIIILAFYYQNPKHIHWQNLIGQEYIDFPKSVMFGQWSYVRPEHLKCWKYEVMQKEKEKTRSI